MVLGILLCIPLVTSLGALVFAIVGMKATRPGGKGGRGMAIAGLVLGIIGTVMWLGGGTMAGMLISASSAPRAVLHDFASKVVSGDDTGALAESDPIITRDGLAQLRTFVAPFGAYSDLTCYSVNISVTPAGERCEMGGVMHFASGDHAFTATLIKAATGGWKMYGFHVM